MFESNSNVLWVGVNKGSFCFTGVLEANFVEPAHDKQSFERTNVLARLELRLQQMQKAYWFLLSPSTFLTFSSVWRGSRALLCMNSFQVKYVVRSSESSYLGLSFRTPGRSQNCHLVGYVNKKLNRKHNKQAAAEMSGKPRLQSKLS
jgi:hypothetical protein